MTARAQTPLDVLVTLDFPASFLDAVRSVDDRVIVHHHPLPEEAVLADLPTDVLRKAEVMYTSSVLPGPAEAPSLRWVQLDTSGIDHVRGTALWESDIPVTTLGGVSPAPLAEWIMMMVLAHAHHLRRTESLAASRTWPSREYRWSRLMPHNLRTSTIAVVGYGRIGKEVARLSRAFGMEVLAVRRGTTLAPESRFGDRAGAPEVTEYGRDCLHEVLARSDYVVLTVPLTPETTGLVGPAELSSMKQGAVLVNGSRGGVVDEVALLAALEGGSLDLVASDVFDEEPLPADHPFWSHPRSVVTPHVAGFAPDYLDAVAALFTTNLRHYLAGNPLLNVADRARGY